MMGIPSIKTGQQIYIGMHHQCTLSTLCYRIVILYGNIMVFPCALNHYYTVLP